MSTVEVAELLWLLLSVIGLALAVSYAGIPVLGQGAFMAVGGFGTALLVDQGWPLGVACGSSALAAAVLGYLIAIGASRLEGATLALATWAFVWLVDRLLLAYPDVSGGRDGRTIPSPAELGSPSLGLEVVLTPVVHVIVAAGLCLAALAALRRLGSGPAALDLAALREGPEVAASLGIDVARRRRVVLAVAGALGGLSGAGSTVLLGLVAPADVSPLVSLELFVAVLLGGTARWWGPVLGVAVIASLPRFADELAQLLDVDAEPARGVLVALLLVLALGLRPTLGRWLARPGHAPGTRHPAERARPELHPGLQGRHLTAVYDGLVALDDVSLDLAPGQVHAVIGPNGSGKTTLLKVLTGEAGTGEVSVVAPLPSGVAARARAGVVRTFQHTALLPGVVADRQVAMGWRGGTGRRGDVLRHLLATPRGRQLTAPGVLGRLGLAHLTGADPQRLTYGDQRLLQVARAAATGAAVLLLDEPAAGMTPLERRTLQRLVRDLAARGHAVLLVEHDVRLVAAVADRVTVLHAGRVIASGPAAEVLADEAVRLAYLGAPA
jgi:branched-chain amino acid transport system permease protein